jgi:hypothetical protein
MCWITGQHVAGQSVGYSDVDGGVTTLTSPYIDATGVADPVIECFVWYSNNQGSNPNLDSMPVLMSNTGGTTWTQVELVNSNTNTWIQKRYRIADFMTPTAQMRMRFQARDLDGGSVVEAGVDDIRVFGFDCDSPRPADINGDGIVDGVDLSIVLSQWGQAGGSGDVDGDGTVDAADLTVLFSDWG